MESYFSNPVLLYILLKLVQLLQWLVRLIFPPLCSKLEEIIFYIENGHILASDQSRADAVVARFLERSQGRYRDSIRLDKMGNRRGRYWFKVAGSNGRDKLLTLTPVSEHCPLNVEEKAVMAALNSLLQKIHVPFLHNIEEVDFDPTAHMILVVQPYITHGSLKDMVHQTSPSHHWRDKYGCGPRTKKAGQDTRTSTIGWFSSSHRESSSISLNDLGARKSEDHYCMTSSPSSVSHGNTPPIGVGHRNSSLRDLLSWSRSSTTSRCERGSGRGLPLDKVASYGRQILQGLLYLYELGFPYSGQLKTANIFVDGDTCKLGGYDNTLLGYRSSFHSLCSSDDVDTLMFGHVIFELACGYELSSVVPGEDDWDRVTDSTLLDVLHFIFHTDTQGHFTANIYKICAHSFFQCVRLLPGHNRQQCSPHLTRQISTLLTELLQGSAHKPSKHGRQRGICSIQ